MSGRKEKESGVGWAVAHPPNKDLARSIGMYNPKMAHHGCRELGQGHQTLKMLL